MSRLTIAKPWCAVIAASKDIAERYLDAFGLSPEIWETIRHDASTMGKRFQRVVVIRPHWQMEFEEVERFERQLKEQWWTLVAIGGSLKVI
jgi:hypothetical protein